MRGPDELLIKVTQIQHNYGDPMTVLERSEFVSVDDLKWDFPELPRRDEKEAIEFLKDQMARNTEGWQRLTSAMDEYEHGWDDFGDERMPGWYFDICERWGDQLEPSDDVQD
jgi:hypothetical protein